MKLPRENAVLVDLGCAIGTFILHYSARFANIPRAFELPGEGTIMRKEVDKLIIGPPRRKPLLPLLDMLEPIEEDFPEIEDLPPEPVEF